MLLVCKDCCVEYSCNHLNTRQYGSLIKSECPRCGNKVLKNISAFLHDQTDNMEDGIHRAINMIKMAHFIGKKINEDGVVVKPKGKKK